MPDWLLNSIVPAAIQLGVGLVFVGIVKQTIADHGRRISNLEHTKLDKDVFEEYKEARRTYGGQR